MQPVSLLSLFKVLKDHRNVKMKVLKITLLGLTDYGSCSKTPTVFAIGGVVAVLFAVVYILFGTF